MHRLGAGMLSTPELNLDADEAGLLAESLKSVAETYNWGAVLDPKVQCLIDLACVCGVVYGDKIPAVYARLKRKSGPQTIQGNVRVMQ